MAQFEFEGTAEVTVWIKVEADCLSDAVRSADDASNREWEMDTVDGDVRNVRLIRNGVEEAKK